MICPSCNEYTARAIAFVRRIFCWHRYGNVVQFRADEPWMRGLPGYKKRFICATCAKCGHFFSFRMD